MKLLVRAIVTGFGLSIGGAIYKKVAQRFGFDDETKAKDREKTVQRQDGATDPSLQS
jgi:hypothetical protein